jgi:iron complex outermembrane recepter protein
MASASRVERFVHPAILVAAFLGASGAAAQAPEPATEVAQASPAPGSPPGAAAEEAAELETVIVTGTRVKGRAPTQSSSPIDAFTGAEFERQGTFDLTDGLRAVAPSFNTQRYPISDGTAFIRPANLRNLPPDQTLVLINGHRRHRSALVNLQAEPFGTVNQGAQAVDFGLIPAAAVDRIEVLRDGASAQYGSDAIAGVINILLKQNPAGISLNSQAGAAFAGDGENYRVSGNWGLPFAGGFFNLTGEYVSAEPTSRGQARGDVAAVAAAVGAGQVPFDGLGQRWGDPQTEGERLFFNTEFEGSDAVRVYGHGNYVRQDFISSFFYRRPVRDPLTTMVRPRGTLFKDNEPAGTFFYGPDDTGGGDGIPDIADNEANQLIAQGKDPADYLTFDGTNWRALNPIHTRFPGGYTPSFGAEIRDWETVFGLRGGADDGLSWDASARYGLNHVEYVLENSINPSLGRLSPLNFRPGTLEQREGGLNLDFVYPVQAGLASPLNVAFGAELRTEAYEIGIGDPDSFSSSPTGVLFGVGSDGFQGDPPDAAGTFSRESQAAYVDLDAQVAGPLTLGAAARFEDSDQYDASFDWKLSARLQVLRGVALRSTVSTGFRAPTPGQINTLDVTTTADATGALVPLGTFPVGHPAAVALGATPVEPEESFNLTGGIVVTPSDSVSLMLDYYRIEVEDRIALANIEITPGSPEQTALINAGVENATLLRSVSFFTNAVDTTVEGLDLAAVARGALGDWGYLAADLRHGYNRQTVDRVKSGTIDGERVYDLENQLPRHRSVLSLNYQTPWRFDALLRVHRYGSWQDRTFGETATFGSAWIVDVVGTVQLPAGYRVSLGADNLFDEYPDEETNSVLRFLGAVRPVSSPFGINGGFWFLRVSANFD